MAKSQIHLPNGTTVSIEGTAEEIARLLKLYSENTAGVSTGFVPKTSRTSKNTVASKAAGHDAEDRIIAIVNAAKESDDADGIERNVLDRSSQVDRVLLPLYINHTHLGHDIGLTTTEICNVLTNLGVKIASSNVSHTVAGPARNYVMGDKARKKGQKNEHAVRYRLSRKGLQYIQSVIKERS